MNHSSTFWPKNGRLNWVPICSFIFRFFSIIFGQPFSLPLLLPSFILVTLLSSSSFLFFILFELLFQFRIFFVKQNGSNCVFNIHSSDATSLWYRNEIKVKWRSVPSKTKRAQGKNKEKKYVSPMNSISQWNNWLSFHVIMALMCNCSCSSPRVTLNVSLLSSDNQNFAPF